MSQIGLGLSSSPRTLSNSGFIALISRRDPAAREAFASKSGVATSDFCSSSYTRGCSRKFVTDLCRKWTSSRDSVDAVDPVVVATCSRESLSYIENGLTLELGSESMSFKMEPSSVSVPNPKRSRY